MSDVQAISQVTIQAFDVHLDSGTWNMEVYTLPRGNPYLPDVNNPGAWTLLGAATGVVSNGTNVPTPLPIPINVTVVAGAIQAFYVTVTNGTAINYTSGAGVPPTGTIFAQDANLIVFVGSGLVYPFSANFNPRVWNRNIYYALGPPCPCYDLAALAQPPLFGTCQALGPWSGGYTQYLGWPFFSGETWMNGCWLSSPYAPDVIDSTITPIEYQSCRQTLLNAAAIAGVNCLVW